MELWLNISVAISRVVSESCLPALVQTLQKKCVNSLLCQMNWYAWVYAACLQAGLPLSHTCWRLRHARLSSSVRLFFFSIFLDEIAVLLKVNVINLSEFGVASLSARMRHWIWCTLMWTELESAALLARYRSAKLSDMPERFTTFCSLLTFESRAQPESNAIRREGVWWKRTDFAFAVRASAAMWAWSQA